MASLLGSNSRFSAPRLSRPLPCTPLINAAQVPAQAISDRPHAYVNALEGTPDSMFGFWFAHSRRSQTVPNI